MSRVELKLGINDLSVEILNQNDYTPVTSVRFSQMGEWNTAQQVRERSSFEAILDAESCRRLAAALITEASEIERQVRQRRRR